MIAVIIAAIAAGNDSLRARRGCQMITADALARELGCTLSDIDDLGLVHGT